MNYQHVQLIICLIGTLFVIFLYGNLLSLSHCKIEENNVKLVTTTIPLSEDTSSDNDKEVNSQSSISNRDKIIDTTIQFNDDRWLDSYEQIHLYLNENYFIPLRQPPLSLERKELLDSVVTVVEDKDGFPALHMNNVCYNMETMEIELFCKSSCDVPDRPSFFRTPGWKFSMITTKNNRWLFKEKGSYLLIPESTNLDIVAMNISSFIIHLIQSISSFPVIRQVLLPTISKQSSPFSTILLNGIRHLLPDTAQFRVFWKEDLIELGSSICFSDLIGVGPLPWIDEISMFINSNDVQLLRSAVYKHYDISLSGREWKFTRVLFALPSTELVGMDSVREYFQKNGNWWYFEKHIQDIEPKEELEMMIDTDVMITVSGSDLVHMVFMLPGSAVIVLHYPNTTDDYWSILAENSAIVYYPIFNFSTPLPPECVRKLHNKTCFESLRSQTIYLNHGQLHNYLRVASVHVNIRKYSKSLV